MHSLLRHLGEKKPAIPIVCFIELANLFLFVYFHIKSISK